MKKKGNRFLMVALLLLLLQSICGLAQNNISQEQIIKLIDNYQYQEALHLTDLLLKNDTNSTSVILLKTKCLAAFGKYNDAIPYLVRALKTDSNNIKVLSSLIEMQTQSGNTEKACLYALKRSKIEPANNYFKYSLANLYYQSEQYKKGLSILMPLYREDTLNINLQKQIVIGLFELRKYDSARMYCNKILQISPNHIWTVNKLANIYIKQGDYKSGLSLTESFLQQDSSNTIILRSNAYLYYLIKDYPRSEYRFEKCVSLKDSSIFTFKYLALSQYRQDDFKHAYRNFTTAYSLDTTDTELCFYYGLTSAKNEMREIGLMYLNKALSRLKASETFSSLIYSEIASIYNEIIYPDTALILLQKALERNPTSPDLLFKIAYQYDTYLNKPDLSIEYYERYLATNPQKNESSTKTLDNAIEVSISKFDYANRRIKALESQKKN